eukprot:TRINITY_DN18054_c3_g2_i1.p1 TRINITY_DN18054_c3_g2~~TRINITY_DN18054_c3_g2_i1.p1  ORF type:complete len:344 (+),score=110.20 TRINITY_DN18054_c3_g2_i1:84-1115(+)
MGCGASTVAADEGVGGNRKEQRQQQQQQQQYQGNVSEQVDETPEYKNEYGFDPSQDGIYLKKPDEKLLPPDSHQFQGEGIYPPPHYPHRRDSEESEGASEEELITQPPMDIAPNEKDQQYIESLQAFQEEMRSYYYKVGPGKYKNQISTMLTGQDPSGRGCPPELRRVYERQLELLVEGKNPFKEQRHKESTPAPATAASAPAAAAAPIHSDKSSSSSSAAGFIPPPPEDTPPKKQPKPTKKKAKPKKEKAKTPAKEANKKDKKKEKPTTEEAEFKERLDAFNDQMKTYFDAAGADVYKGHVQGLIDTHAIPEELQDMYEKQLAALNQGKNPWGDKAKKPKKK